MRSLLSLFRTPETGRPGAPARICAAAPALVLALGTGCAALMGDVRKECDALLESQGLCPKVSASPAAPVPPPPPSPVVIAATPAEAASTPSEPEPPEGEPPSGPDPELLKSVLGQMHQPGAGPEETPLNDALDKLIGQEQCQKIIGIRAEVDRDAAPFLKDLPQEYRSRSFPSFLSGSTQKEFERNLLTAMIEINGQIIRALEKALGFKIPIHPLRLPTGPEHFKPHFVPKTRRQRLLLTTGIDPAFATRLLYLALDSAETNASCGTITEPEKTPSPDREPISPRPENPSKIGPGNPLDLDVCPPDTTLLDGECFPKDLPPLDLPPLPD
ncbi:hypothetical protein HZA43_03420 [Candidatus Peregrinibacteria bacterium]|nr:hypothetical protein [Candidatus Peregrinibacteria bacterium]